LNQTINLEGLPGPVQKILKPYLTRLQKLLGTNLKSILIFGSGLGQDFIPGRSNINLLLVCDRVDLELLKGSLKLVAEGRKKGIVAPLFLTQTHMETSADVFPIEFMEFRDFHRVLYGEDPFRDLSINPEHLRLECEEQLKGKLIRLRQAYLEVGSSLKQLQSLLSDSITSLIPVFRGLLRLKGLSAPGEKGAVVEEMARQFGINKEVFNQILKLKAGQAKPKLPELNSLFDRYLDALQGLAIAVDQLKA
jgi:hypothetical protein